MSEAKEPELLFFLGAGASVAADVPDTFKLVKRFVGDLTKRHKNLEFENCKTVLKILEESRLVPDGKVDIELLLEALDELEYINKSIPLKFFKVSDCVLGPDIESQAGNLKKELKDFIKRTGLVDKDDIQYLKDLLLFIEEQPHKPLDIFSVNYDICIEQFCDTFEKEYVDGFYLQWEPQSLRRRDVDVRLHKIHGSITWYRTNKGSLVKLPIKSEQAEIELTTGEKASALILYPMRKLEYTEPLMDLLMILKRKLDHAKFAFVVGYSFRDNQIRQIFWNAAKRNKELVLFLISPDAHKVYEERLRNYDEGIPSDLEGRVICLPYKFEKVLHLLKNLYLRALIAGLRIENECKANENVGNPARWDYCLGQFINCEHIEKCEEVLQKGAWEVYREGTPSDLAKTAFKAFLTALTANNASYKEIWASKLDDLFSKLIDATKLHFDFTTRANERIIQPVFEFADGSRFRYDRCSELLRSMLDDCRFKMSLMIEEQTSNVAKVEKMLEKILAYFDQFNKGEITLTEYIKIRKDKHSKLIDQVKEEAEKPVSNQRLLETISKILNEVEEIELKEILGGTKLLFRFSSNFITETC